MASDMSGVASQINALFNQVGQRISEAKESADLISKVNEENLKRQQENEQILKENGNLIQKNMQEGQILQNFCNELGSNLFR